MDRFVQLYKKHKNSNIRNRPAWLGCRKQHTFYKIVYKNEQILRVDASIYYPEIEIV